MSRTSSMETLILTGDDVRRLVHRVGLDEIMEALVARLNRALLEYSADETVVPVRDGFSYCVPETGLIEWMPCRRSGSDITIKIVGYHPANPVRRDLPTIISTMSLYDSTSGHLECVMDATLLTALRTGAATAVATGFMADPDARVLGIVGAGAQAVAQVHAVSRVTDIDRVLVFDIDRTASDSFGRRVSRTCDHLGIEVADLDTITRESDILCTATSVEPGKGPVIPDTRMKPRVHINAVGSDFPGKTEIPPGVLERSVVVPDFLAQAVKEGECQQMHRDSIAPELHLLLKDAVTGIDLKNRQTVFDSTGWALEDSIAMHVMLEYAAEFDLGRQMSLESISADPRDPYHELSALKVLDRSK